MPCTIDHLTVTAPTLAAGVAYVQDRLGVPLDPGGAHPRMGTHNALLRLGEGLFLEVIAVDPAAPAPAHRRWFDLDRLGAGASPRLAAWVARCDDIHAAIAASPVSLGTVRTMTRGALEWRIGIPESGRAPHDGVLPMLIQWPPGVHPAAALPERGCSLVALQGFHREPAGVRTTLAAIGFSGDFAVAPPAGDEPPRLVATFQTPLGIRQL